MRRRPGRRDRRCFRQGCVVPGIRRYLLCLHNDTSDTDSDSIPLSSLLDDADTTEAVDYSTTLLSQSINPAVCTGLMQMYSAANSGADTRQLIAHRMSVVRSAMPLFTHHHLQLPLFTGQRRWHTMFGQLSQLTSSVCGRVGSATLNTDEDILADSNFASLFDTSPDDDCYRAVEPVNSHGAYDLQATSHELSQNTTMDLGENNFPVLDENADSLQSAVEQFMLNANIQQLGRNTNCASPSLSVTSAACGRDQAVNHVAHYGSLNHEHVGQCLGSLPVSYGSQSRTLLGRRHSDPGSIHSSTTGTSSTNSNSDNWYYYDHRLGPGGSLAAQYGRLRTRRSLSVIMFPPAYDDVVHDALVPTAVDQYTTGPSSEHFLTVSESPRENVTELPPPYQETEQPPSYSDVSDADINEQLGNAHGPSPSTTSPNCSQPSGAENWRSVDNSVPMTRCSHSRGMFTGRPAVRWNRNTRVERWTSSFNWVMS